jgi:DNA-binding XRE family transcriptional regulator
MAFSLSEYGAMKDSNQKEKFLKKFGAHVRKVRMAAGYSQDRVYLEGGLSRATMSRIEQGKVDAQIYTLIRVAETIGIPLKKLVDFE